MVTDRARRTTATLAALALTGALAGCADTSPEGSATPSDTTTPSPDGTSTPTATTDPSPDGEAPPDGETPAPVPPGFPDPETLVGQEAYDEQSPDGTWRTVVGGEPLDVAMIFGSCFEGGTGDVCGYSISGSGAAGPDGTPEPSEAALLLLLESTGESPEGTPTWQVLDATITRPPEEPAILQSCDGEEGVAFYPAGDADDAGTVPVAAAWGPDADVTALVERDPADVTCNYAGP